MILGFRKGLGLQAHFGKEIVCGLEPKKMCVFPPPPCTDESQCFFPSKLDKTKFMP
jgi:hypothetical protein